MRTGGAGSDGDRVGLEAAWLDLTRHLLPHMAATRDWPIRADHCFQRVLLDGAVGGVWYDAVTGRPAYRFIATALLARAVDLGHAVLCGYEDVATLNLRSLAWRYERKRRSGTLALL
jgi:hypothetical protein